jgi:HAD superfamily hydrolase (TIGR01662 family)
MALIDAAVVVPTLGRQSLADLLESLAASQGPLPRQLVIVDDRPGTGAALPAAPARLAGLVTECRSGGRGPAAARNTGWRAVDRTCRWVVFLDDDVVVRRDWLARLAADLDTSPEIGGVQGRVHVPLPPDRAPTDWERATKGLEEAAWITADMAYRRAALERVGGFDERFPRAYREDADLALRVQSTGAVLVVGERETVHPVRPVDRWASVRAQAGNADDPLMRRVHGPGWRKDVRAPAGRRPAHVAVTAAGLAGLVAAAAGARRLAALGAALWSLGTAQFAWSRIAPGPRTGDEVATMLATSVLIPPVATYHWLGGLWRHRLAGPWTAATETRAVLFDRDGTLVHDVPYNGEPDNVRPVDGAVEVVAELRARGIRTGVITNQSGIGRGMLSAEQVAQVNQRIDDIFGGFDVWQVCPHSPEDLCRCRKPAATMVHAAAAELGVAAHEVVVIGDIGADMAAAAAAGARGILVPTSETLPSEVAAAPKVAVDLREAVRLAVGTAP